MDIANLYMEAAKQVRYAQEAYLLEVFGSLEEAQRIGHLYILEEEPCESYTSHDLSNDSAIFRLTYRYRVRLKTDEELADDLLKATEPT